MSLLEIKYLHSFNKIMKKGSSGSQPKPKKPKTSSDITSKLLKGIHDGLAKQLSTGKMTINPISKSLPKANYQRLLQSNPQKYMESIESNLKELKNSIEQQKRAQQEQQRQKLQKAQELIQRMRKEKEEHQQKLRQNSKLQVLHRRLYSQTTLNQMRQKLEERIANKRMQIEERVKAIQERKMKRDEQVANHEVEYWQHRKEMKQKAKSSTKLPVLSTPTSNEENSGLFPTIPRKNSHGVIPKLAEQYQKQASRMMQLAKMKQQNIKLKQFQENYSSRLQSIVKGHQSLQQQLQQKTSLKGSALIPSYNDNRHKIMGNQFLKESLLMIRKQPNNSNASDPQPQTTEKEPAVNGRQAQINNNSQVETLRQKWARMLSKVRHGQITREQGLQILNGIQKRLDKIDLLGVKDRLRQKYEVFSGQLPLSSSLNSVQTESLELQK